MKRMTLSLAGAAAIALSGFGGLALTPVPVQAGEATKAETIASGSFVTVEQDHPTAGTATIVTGDDGQTYLQFSDNFTTARGPAVYVVLHAEETVDVHIEGEDYITLAPLESFDGAQWYLIPDTVDVSDYNSVVIWCERFDVTFGYAAL